MGLALQFGHEIVSFLYDRNALFIVKMQLIRTTVLFALQKVPDRLLLHDLAIELNELGVL